MTTKSAILEGNKRFMAAVSRRDASEVSSLYASGALLLPPHSDFVSGQEAIRQFWQGVIDMGIRRIKLETVEVEGGNDAAVEIGKYTLFAEGDAAADAGKYLVVWKNEGGSWKLYRDIWNTSR